MTNSWNETYPSEIAARIAKLTPDSRPQWGKMAVGQMLAHCNVTYELAFENKHPKPNAVLRFILKLLIKPSVVSAKPYKRNSPTGPVFVVKDTKDFAAEKSRLLAYVNKTRDLGEAHFQGRAYHSFGPMTAGEWHNMLHKHLEHHLGQFGV